jgi:hypothetical protein
MRKIVVCRVEKRNDRLVWRIRRCFDSSLLRWQDRGDGLGAVHEHEALPVVAHALGGPEGRSRHQDTSSSSAESATALTQQIATAPLAVGIPAGETRPVRAIRLSSLSFFLKFFDALDSNRPLHP